MSEKNLKDLKLEILEGDENKKIQRERINQERMHETVYRRVRLVVEEDGEYKPVLFMDNKNEPDESVFIKVEENEYYL